MTKPINNVIRILITSDFIFNCGWGLLSPVFALFIAQKITGGDITKALFVAGLATFFYWIPKSLLQIPIGKYLDKNHGEKDDFIFMVAGTFMAGLVPFIFLIASLPWHIYVAQIVHATSMALVIPSWLAVFTRHIDRGKEAFEWGLESTAIGIGAGVAAALGGVATAVLGFEIVFALTGIFTIFSAALLLLIHKNILPPSKAKPVIPLVKPKEPPNKITTQ